MTGKQKDPTPERHPNQTERPEIDPDKIQVLTGGMAPPLAEQLGVEPEKIEHFQKDMDALVRLRVRGIIPDDTAHRGETKVLNQMVKELTGKSGKFKAARRKR